jgi:hypothetical protein
MMYEDGSTLMLSDMMIRDMHLSVITCLSDK